MIKIIHTGDVLCKYENNITYQMIYRRTCYLCTGIIY